VRPLNLLSTPVFLIIFSCVAIFSQPVVIERSIQYSDVNNATVVGEDGLAMRTTDGGFTWSELTTGITNVLYGNTNFDSLTTIAVGENGVILKTTDGGANWEQKTSGVFTHLYDVCVVDQSSCCACGEDGILLFTYDNGESWSQIYTQPGIDLNDVKFIDANTGFAVGSSSTVLKTVDGGVSWTNVRTSFDTYIINAIGIRTDMLLTVVGEGGLIYNSTDGGYNWTISSFQPDMNIKDIVFFTQNEGIMVGSNSSIYKTTDGGNNWFSVSPTTAFVLIPTVLYSVAFSSLTDGMLVGENSTEMYTTDGGSTWTTSRVTPNDIADRSNNNRPINYPNPFNPSTIISFNMPDPGTISVKVYDITGREVADLFEGSINAGARQFLFDASKLSSGVYIYRIASKIKDVTNTVTGRMLLVK